MTIYYPPYLRFAGEKYQLTPAEWEEYWGIIGYPRELEEYYQITRKFLLSKGFIHED